MLSTARLKVPVVVASGVLLSLAGGYAIVWEGTRQLAQNPHVTFVTDEHVIEDADQYVTQLLDMFGKTSRPRSRYKAAGLVCDLLPPDHFIVDVAKSDRGLAEALLRQDESYFEDPAAVDKVLALFARDQKRLSDQYLLWFTSGGSQDLPAWRYQGHSGGLLELLERKCRQESIPLRRRDQPWMEWQAQFRYEYSWQRSLATLGQGDHEGYKRFVNEIFIHQDALSHHQALLHERVAELHMTISSDSERGRPGFVYIQTPVYAALSTYPEFRDLDENESLDTGVRIGTLYVVEEILRRARLNKGGSPREALTFAEKAVTQIQDPQLVAWWSQPEAIGPQEILGSLMQNGLIDKNQVEAEGLVNWFELPQDRVGP